MSPGVHQDFGGFVDIDAMPIMGQVVERSVTFAVYRVGIGLCFQQQLEDVDWYLWAGADKQMDEGTDAGEFVDVFDVLLDTFLNLLIWLLDVLAQLLDQQRDYPIGNL